MSHRRGATIRMRLAQGRPDRALCLRDRARPDGTSSGHRKYDHIGDNAKKPWLVAASLLDDNGIHTCCWEPMSMMTGEKGSMTYSAGKKVESASAVPTLVHMLVSLPLRIDLVRCRRHPSRRQYLLRSLVSGHAEFRGLGELGRQIGRCT